MATMLCADVDFINVAGVWLTDSVAVRYVKPDLAIVHIGWGLKDDYDAYGTPRKPKHGIFTWVVIKQEKQWQLLAGHNVNIREPVVPVK